MFGFGIGEAAAIAGVISTLKSLNDGLSTIKESGAHAGSLVTLVSRYGEVEKKIQEVESAKGGVLDLKQSMQMQGAKRQAQTFNRQLKDALLMSGQASQYNEIMTRIEESREAHEKAVAKLKRAKQKRKKELQEAFKVIGIFFVTAAVIFVIAMVVMAYY